VPGIRPHRDVLAVPHDRAVLVHVQVHLAVAVSDLPEVEGVLLRRRREGVAGRVLQADQFLGRVERLAVDQPLQLAAGTAPAAPRRSAGRPAASASSPAAAEGPAAAAYMLDRALAGRIVAGAPRRRPAAPAMIPVDRNHLSLLECRLDRFSAV
jgi:hypothetical protein